MLPHINYYQPEFVLPKLNDAVYLTNYKPTAYYLLQQKIKY